MKKIQIIHKIYIYKSSCVCFNLIFFFMVYKIRNKSFFWTRAGWKNNWHPKNFNAPRPSHSEFTMGIRCRYDHHSFLRAYNSYRKISRNCRQYFYGSRELEVIFQLTKLTRKYSKWE